ncbi:MAG: ribosome-associated translation inhibitor RaiA [Alphaproteobacteria bacterium]|nr:ribosome-associated translation inhibitor RaiA [Alphaproteobacteria bacterium]
MQLTVTGKQIDVGQALQGHVEEKLQATIAKYFANPVEIHVVFSRDAHELRADLTVHVGRGITVRGHGRHGDPYGAFDVALDHIGKRLRRHKRRLRSHHKNRDKAVEMIEAQQYVLQSADGEGSDVGGLDEHVVIAEMTTEIPSLTVEEAVMRMDLEDASQLMFRNSAHGGLNMIYRRRDGNIGWVDPRGNRDAL